MVHTVSVDLGSRVITFETGKIAKQAHGAVVVRTGDSVVLATACSNENPKPGAGFFPLTVDYREYTYAAGRFPGGFIKREGRPSEREILTSRLIDRPVRPLFPEGYMCDTQIIAMVLSADPVHDPSTLAVMGGAAALAISDIPFYHVLAGARVALVDGEMIAEPSYEQIKAAEFSIVVAGTEEGIVMVEAAGTGVSEDRVVDCIEFGHECCKKIIAGIKELQRLAGKTKRVFEPAAVNQEMLAQITAKYRDALVDAMNTEKHGKIESYRQVDALYAAAKADFPEEQQAEAGKLFNGLKERVFRDEILGARRRPDGRAFDQIRQIDIEVGILPRTHGSALFTRGETQALVTTTLGTKDDEQRMEMLSEGEVSKRFMLHYNFPPFSVGEVKFLRSPGRREIGHGALAERAVAAVLPEEGYPYTIRVVSEVLESNGSSSMATVCGATLSLMDAGVPIQAPVAGIAMGLIKEGEEIRVLSDILGDEDHLGDMDFKVAGTKQGVTALQMDIKIGRVTRDIMKEALYQAQEGRLHILDRMGTTMATPREEMSVHAPRITTLKIKPDKIRDIIGPGGKVIRGIIEETGVKIDVEDDGTVLIASNDGEAMKRAIEIIQGITMEPEVGKTYKGTVRKIVDFGAFVEILPGTDGLLHISQIAPERINKVTDVLQEGEEVLVKVLEIDKQGKIRLSRREAMAEAAKQSS